MKRSYENRVVILGDFIIHILAFLLSNVILVAREVD